MDDVFSVSNVEIVNPTTTSTSNSNHRDHESCRRGRLRKLPRHSPEKPLPLHPPPLPARRIPWFPAKNGELVSARDIANAVVVGGVVRAMPVMDVVVKVFCVHTEPNFSLPWQRKCQYSSSSSGFVIGGRRILTNAYSVDHYTQVKLKKRGSDTKYLPIFLTIGTE